MISIEFTIPGEPIAQGRPKFTTRGGFPRAYDPEKSRTYKEYVADIAREYAPPELIKGPVLLYVKLYRSIPKNFSGIKHYMANEGKLKPITKPDLSNCVKGIEDALNGIIWKDDSQVVESHVYKLYSDDPRAEVKIVMLQDNVTRNKR